MIRSTRSTRGSSLVELVVGTGLGMLVLAGLAAALAAGGRLLAVTAARGELEDIAHIAVESLAFDVRRAGFDPAAAGVAPIIDAHPDRITLTGDLDGDGLVATNSEETITWICATGTGRLSRIVGRQSLPLADGVTRCRFRYVDAAGTDIPAPSTGLSGTDRERIRAVGIDLLVGTSALRMPTARAPLIGLRVRS